MKISNKPKKTDAGNPRAPVADAPVETRELEYGKGSQAKKSKGGDKEPFAPLPRRSLFA